MVTSEMVTSDEIQVVISNSGQLTVDSGPMSEFVGIAALAEIPAIRMRGQYHFVIETLDEMRRAAETAFANAYQ